jgi:pimeloyl-ACP methyl ester carboxylesterase
VPALPGEAATGLDAPSAGSAFDLWCAERVRSPVPMATAATRLQERTIPFTAGDGFQCNLVNVRGDAEPINGPVLVVHGAGVSAGIFRPPTGRTLIDALIAGGYDVWLENWRGSVEFPQIQWTLDQAAVFDHPAAVKRVAEETGCDRIKAMVHCQGSTGFFMGLVAGLMPQVTTVVSNAVSLHPLIPMLSQVKIECSRVFSYLTDVMNPQWALHAPTLPAKVIDLLVKLTHHECDNPVCKHVSFTYGAGFPSLWLHENLTPETHEWIKQQFAACPMSFFRQMAISVRRGCIVAVEGRKELPPHVLAGPPQTDARIAFIAGEANQCFLPESQVRTFRYFEGFRTAYHSLHVFPGYSHLDLFLGKNASVDVFPTIVRELDRKP